jgi:CBS domain-containing protein
MNLTAGDIMSHPAICAREGMTVRELIALLREERISGVPVVDAEESLSGVISITDLLSLGLDPDEEAPEESDFHTSPSMDRMSEASDLLAPEEEVLDRPIAHLMSRHVITTSEKATVGEVADLMLSHRIHRLIIVRGAKIVGIVSVSDVLKSLQRQYRGDR